MRNFGEFFIDQVENASCIVLSHTGKISEEKLSVALSLLKEKNENATVVTADWDSVNGKEILAAMEKKNSLKNEMEALMDEVKEHHHEHDECDDPNCSCHHHDHEHHHGHDECDDPNCCCRHHEHEHHHGHHHADDVFTSWGFETARKFTKEELVSALEEIGNQEKYGVVLRAKGIVAGEESWLHFDYVPEEPDVREGSASVTGRLCVIGCNLNEAALKTLFKA